MWTMCEILDFLFWNFFLENKRKKLINSLFNYFAKSYLLIAGLYISFVKNFC